MTFDASRWVLWRNTAEFSQRFEATVNSDATAMEGRWEKSFDNGSTWQHNFDVNYTKADSQ